ncbi:MAG: helix-turn-helix transcriptional regulator [Acidobacteria bacterium]|nr:helix-turn-helix transcriptional regulator [Acidobacteriota bacterium]
MGRSHRPRPARLGEKLRKIRVSLGVTLEQMIERLDYKDSPLYPTNISGMERGEREPPLLLLLAYARLAGISTDVLIDDSLELPNRLFRKRNAAVELDIKNRRGLRGK